MLLREYQGERHTVTVVANGYVWREATYASLSTIARAITGTAWNGPRFFGLRSGGESAISTDVADASSGPPNGQLARECRRSSHVRPSLRDVGAANPLLQHLPFGDGERGP